MKTKAIVREEVWQHDQEQSRRSRKTSWCVLGIAKVSQRDTMLSFTAGVSLSGLHRLVFVKTCPGLSYYISFIFLLKYSRGRE